MASLKQARLEDQQAAQRQKNINETGLFDINVDVQNDEDVSESIEDSAMN